jgi:hypothetical protein
LLSLWLFSISDKPEKRKTSTNDEPALKHLASNLIIQKFFILEIEAKTNGGTLVTSISDKPEKKRKDFNKRRTFS